MKLIRGLHNLKRYNQSLCKTGCVATIGNFDGVHQGHQTIIRQVKEKAAEMGLPSVVMVFEPQPREFFVGKDAPPRLMRFREKLVALQAQSVDYVVCLQFTPRLRSLSAAQFIDSVLLDGLNIKHMVVGDDFRFGCDRSGDFVLLESVGGDKGFSVEHTQTIEIDGERVSSTRIREHLDANEFSVAEKLLGHRYGISGCVIHGRKLGRQLGVPTANVSLGRKKPALNGVYAVEAFLENEKHLFGVANIGIRPTVDGLQPSLEVHLFDFEGDLYGQHIKVIFNKRIRDEMRFDGIEQLKAQILRDIEETRAFFALN